MAYYRKRLQASALQALIATVSPAGPYPLPLADWIALRINPAGWRGWLAPGLAHAFLWTLTSFNRSARDSARQEAIRRLETFYASWWRVAPAYPGWMVILTPGFWIYILELQRIVDTVPEPYSTRHIRDQTDWSGFTPSQMADLLRGPNVDWGPLAEAVETKNRDAARWSRLREKTIKTAKQWSPEVSFRDVSLVKETKTPT